MQEESQQVQHGSCGRAQGPWAGDVLGVQGEAAAGLGGALRFSMETPHLQMVHSREGRVRTGVIPRCVRLWKVSAQKPNLQMACLGKFCLGLLLSGQKSSLASFFFPFYRMKGLPNQHENI